MKLITLCTAVVIWGLTLNYACAQETEAVASAIEQLEDKKTDVVETEKSYLTLEVDAINKRLENDEITLVEAEEEKKAAAEKHALNIENKLSILDNQIDLLKRNGEVNLNTNQGQISIGMGDLNKDGDFIFGVSVNDGKQRTRKTDIRTRSGIVFSFGLNNVIGDGQSLDDSPYKIGGSRYAEIGFGLSTRVFKDHNWLRLRYGVSFQFNSLKPTDNRYLVDTGTMTELQEFPIDLRKSKFRMDNLVIPVHFEFGPSRKVERDGYFRYYNDKSFKVGVGGYVGVNLGARQKLKFDEAGEEVKQKLKAGYNTNNMIYGLSGYVGYGDISLYAKYDLNSVFKDNTVDEHMVSMGLRWDWL